MASAVAVYFIVGLAASVVANYRNYHCDTIVQPTEVVLLKHDIATFTCSASSDLLKHPQIVLDGLHSLNLDAADSSYEGVTWEKLNTTRNETIYLIFLNTTFLKSGKIDFLCIIQSGKCSKGGHLYVVESLPPKLSPPIVEVLNSSAANILWGSPWSYPVNNYTLTISNSMTNTTLFIITTTGNSIIITKDNINDCTLLCVAVFANTDIGSNEISDSRIFGFPKSLELIETSRIAKYINTTYKDYACIFINIGVIVPDVCSYDNLTYMFSIINETNNEPIMYQYSNTPNTTLNLKSSSPTENDRRFNITVAVISTNAKFKEERLFVLYSNYSISTPMMSSSVTITPTSTATPISPTTDVYIAIGIIIPSIIIIIIIVLIGITYSKRKPSIDHDQNDGILLKTFKIKDAVTCLADIEHKWYEIGIALGVTHAKLEGLKQDPSSNTSKLYSVIRHWKDQSTDDPTWNDLIKAIEGRVVDSRLTAKNIRQFLKEPETKR